MARLRDMSDDELLAHQRRQLEAIKTKHPFARDFDLRELNRTEKERGRRRALKTAAGPLG